MSFFTHFDATREPRSKIELHVHLDGSVRIPTIWELMHKKSQNIPVKTLQELYKLCSSSTPSTLSNFLKPFGIFIPLMKGDAEALERIAYEFCEDLSNQGILYCEARYVPHLLASTNDNSDHSHKTLSPRNVVECINRGLDRGQAEFHLKVRTILCCFRSCPEWSEDILDLCVEFREKGVVGIDIAGDEAQVMAAPEDVLVFQRAAALGIHRTAHAGEAGPASNVAMALNEMYAQRIGHGYRVVEDPETYMDCIHSGVHFETCPYSSYLTGAVPLTTLKHPIVKFAEDNVNFSISRDDPTLIQRTLEQEYDLLGSFGLKHIHFTRANLNAARSCFLPNEEKKELLEEMKELYGMHSSISHTLFKPHLTMPI